MWFGPSHVGRGQVLELRNAARSAVVRFDNGIRAVVQSNMLSTLQPAADAVSANHGVRPGQLFAPRPERVFTPETTERLEARRTIEALRYGVVPVNRIRELSVGLDDERASLHRAFAEVNESGGEVRVILGEYGASKSHFFELAAQEALEQNFLVATTSLDLREVPPNRPQRIYHSLMRSLRYPHSPDTGLRPLLERLITQPHYSTLQDTLRGTFFASALHNYSLMRERPGEALDLLLDWMSGEKVFIKSVRDAAAISSKEFPLPSLSQMTTAADQYCYLLNGWGWLATQAGHAGLAVFIDESEHYSLLTQRSQERADNFFKALIYTALGARGRVGENDLQHQYRAHSFRLTEQSHLLLLFALTPSANTFDYRRWLDEEQVLALNKYLPPAAINELLARLYRAHRRAYAYDDHEQFTDVAQGLFECMDSNLINLRQVIRLAVEIFDLCYAHKNYRPAQAIAELRGAALRPGPQWHKLYEERSLYSNLADAGRDTAVVVDDITGRRVGYLESAVPTGTTFLMGGQARRVVWTQGRRLLAHAATDNTAEARAPRRRTPWRSLSPALTQALAQELGFPCAEPSPALPMVFVRRESADELATDQAESRTLLFHCAGEIYGRALGELLETKLGARIVECNEFLVEALGSLPETMLLFTEEETLALVGRRWRQFERAFDLGRFHTQLPPAVRRASVIAAFNVPAFQRCFACR